MGSRPPPPTLQEQGARGLRPPRPQEGGAVGPRPPPTQAAGGRCCGPLVPPDRRKEVLRALAPSPGRKREVLGALGSPGCRREVLQALGPSRLQQGGAAGPRPPQAAGGRCCCPLPLDAPTQEILVWLLLHSDSPLLRSAVGIYKSKAADCIPFLTAVCATGRLSPQKRFLALHSFPLWGLHTSGLLAAQERGSPARTLTVQEASALYLPASRPAGWNALHAGDVDAPTPASLRSRSLPPLQAHTQEHRFTELSRNSASVNNSYTHLLSSHTSL